MNYERQNADKYCEQERDFLYYSTRDILAKKFGISLN